MFTIKQIKLMTELVKSGITKECLFELYDVLKSDSETQSFPTPPNSQPTPECANNESISPPSSQQYSSSMGIQSPPDTDEEHWLQTTASAEKRRDRFVFRSVHHNILNEAFLKNAYPENDDKEALVDQCNEALERYKNRTLKESEKMTVLNITNWFNNRRKEKRRKWNSDMHSLDNPASLDFPLEDRIKEEIVSAD